MDRAAVPYLLLMLLLGAGILTALVLEARRQRRRVVERRNEARWQRIVEALPELVWTATGDGRADYFSPQSFTFTGLAEDALLGWGWLDAVHEDERESSKEAWTRAVAEGHEYRVEHRFRRFDGEYRWFACQGSPLRDTFGKIVTWVGVAFDVTDRRLAEERAKNANRHLDIMMRLSQSSLWELAIPDGNVSRGRIVNNDLLIARGFEAAALPDADYEEALVRVGIVPEDREPFTRAIQSSIDADASEFQTEYRSIAADGAVCYRMTRGAISRDSRGKATSVVGVGTDITNLRRAEQETRVIKERLERAITGSKTFTWDHCLVDGTMAGATSAYTNLWESLGYEPNDADFASTTATLLHPDDVDGHLAALHDFLTGREREWQREVRFCHKDGTERWYLTRGTVERDPVSGKAVRYTGCSVDVTAWKRIEQELRESEEKFRATFENAAVGMAFIVTPGHFAECNQMLGNLLGYARDEIVGRSFTAFGVSDEQSLELEHYRALVHGDVASFSRDKQFVRKDGSLLWASVSVSVLRRDRARLPSHVLEIVQDISARKSLEDELRRAKETVELAIRGSDLSIFDLDMPDGALDKAKLTLINYWEQLGYDPTTAPQGLASVASIVMAPDEQDSAERDLAAYLSGASPRYEIERPLLRKDGSRKWVIARGVAVRNERGVAVRFIGSHSDITQRKRVEERLRESERRWRTLTDALPLFVWTAAADGSVEYMSEQACEYSGLPELELLGDGWEQATHPDDLAHTRHKYSESIANETPHEVQHRFRRRDGEYRWFTTRGVPVRDAQGRVFEWVGSSTDVTELKEIEADLRRAKDLLELSVRGSKVGVFEFDMPDGVIDTTRQTMINAWEALGYDAATVAANGTPRTLLGVHPDDLARVEDDIERYLRRESAQFEVEYRVLHKDGSVLWRLARGSALWTPDGIPTRLLGTSVDITERKGIEKDLQRAREAAETANRTKDEFLANVSHEIRTPMNAILGMTELALDAAETDHQRQLLSTVKSAATNLLGIINDLLDFSRIAAGKLALDEADFWLRAEVGDTVRALLARAHRKGLELICHVHPDVPDALFGDAGRVRQVLMNLIGNALKFTAQGEVVVTVTTNRQASTGELVSLTFTIRDTGIGIAQDKHAAIFRAFEQEDSSTTRRYGGTGLGLTISAQLAALMSGGIDVDSEPGQGSTFTFTARFARSSRPEAQQSDLLQTISVVMNAPTGDTADRAPGNPGRSDLRRGALTRSPPIRILVAEDNQPNAVLLKTLLKKRGHRAQFAADGRVALRRATESTFDLLLLDLHMPELDGFQVVRAIREAERTTGKHLPIVALTARSSNRDRDRCLAAGMDDFLPKPIEAEALRATIERMMASFPPTSFRESRLLDARAILRACAGEPDVFDGLREVFLRALPFQMERVRSAVGEHALPRLAEAAHTLVGTLGAFSTVASAVALTLEDTAKREDFESCSELVDRLDAMCSELVEDTRELMMDDLGL